MDRRAIHRKPPNNREPALRLYEMASMDDPTPLTV